VRADLFKPFKKSGNHGAGLGLVIVAEIVRAHGGSIAVEKTSPAGTAFLVVLPAVEEAPAAKGNGRGAARQR
jgi:C4-dicarboxylate-specific signal transduction histidine kinase